MISTNFAADYKISDTEQNNEDIVNNNKHTSHATNNPFKQNHYSNNPLDEDNSINENQPTQTSRAKLIVLNKITTKSSEVTLEVGETKAIGGLSVELHKCVKANDPYNAHNWMLLTISDNKIIDNQQVFSGWVLSSNQSLSSLEHPVYEVIPRNCVIAKKD